MEFPKAGSGPNRQQIIDALRNTAQSASNNIAETASMPVDALAWALRKVGVPVGDKPIMGSDWMREKGLTAPVQEGASKVVGDTIGMLAPAGLSKAGAQAMMEVGGKMKNLPVGLSIKDVSGPQSQALILAQQRAALPVEQGGLGLAAGNTPAERAAAMGFDKDVYHGTPKQMQFDELKPSQAGAVYATKKPEYANDFSKRKMVIDPMTADDYVGQVLPLKANMGKSTKLTVSQMEDAGYSPNFIKQMIEQGYDSGLSRDGQIIFTSPDQIRSRFAAFDPFRKTAATAAAMGVAAPDLLAQERNNGNR